MTDKIPKDLVEAFTAAFHRITQGERSVVLDVPEELACNALVESFNAMSKHIDQAFATFQADSAEQTQELEKTRQELLKQINDAGMAKLAIGLMHNIGNALTPAIIGTSTSMKFLQNSALRHHLAAALKPLQKLLHNTPLLDEHVRYRLSQIVRMLPDSIHEEYTQVIIALERISERHRHIEEIIRLQMRYAHTHSERQRIHLNQLVLDALKILNSLITEHQIEVIPNFSDVPPIYWEETNLLQVLINVIKNGCEAMFETAPSMRQLTLTIALAKDPDVLVFRVEDNGVGFTAEEKEKLFTFGYSTKNHSLGFGLHTCANELIERNGSIECVSPGPGQGAVFTLKLLLA